MVSILRNIADLSKLLLVILHQLLVFIGPHDSWWGPCTLNQHLTKFDSHTFCESADINSIIRCVTALWKGHLTWWLRSFQPEVKTPPCICSHRFDWFPHKIPYGIPSRPAPPVPQESRESHNYELNGRDFGCPGFHGNSHSLPVWALQWIFTCRHWAMKLAGPATPQLQL